MEAVRTTSQASSSSSSAAPRVIIDDAASLAWAQQKVDSASQAVAERIVRLPPPTEAGQGGRTVLLTGTTGSLGAALVHELAIDPSVDRIIALTRGHGDDDAERRLAEALEEQGYPRHLSSGGSGQGKIVTLAFDPHDLPALFARHQHLVHDVSDVLVVGWHVNFLKAAPEFAPIVDSTLDLLVFCHTGRRKSLHFVSTIGAMMGRAARLPRDSDEQITAHALVQHRLGPSPSASSREPGGLGYAISKWTTEAILTRLSEDGKLRCDVALHRVGQIAGSRVTRRWHNLKEAFAQLVEYSSTRRVWPRDLQGGSVDWLPVDEVAKFIVRRVKATTTEKGLRAYNVTHPHPITWDDLRRAIEASGQLLKDVLGTEWMAGYVAERGRTLAPALGALVMTPGPRRRMASYESALAKDEDDGAVVPPLSQGDVADWLKSWQGRTVAKLSGVKEEEEEAAAASAKL